MRAPLLPSLCLITLLLTACNRKSLEQALAPDPRLSPNSNATPAAQTPIVQPSSSPSNSPTPSPSTTPGLGGYTDLDGTPAELRNYLNDLLQLNQLPLNCNPPCTTFSPNQPIQRREYARWLVAANNRFYQDSQPNLIRLATASATPAFTDLPKTDPDFPAIQALAEAGLIPSPLSNDKAPKEFKPNNPLTREDLILWKVPIDLRSLPPSTPDKNLPFQDLTKLSPATLNAITADSKNGNQANFRRAFGYTTLFQPQRPVTRAEAAAVLWHFGTSAAPRTAQTLLNPTSSPTPTSTPSPTSSPK
jgi:hypothetical protein